MDTTDNLIKKSLQTLKKILNILFKRVTRGYRFIKSLAGIRKIYG